MGLTSKTQYASNHLGVNVTDFLKPKIHLRQKSETDFLDEEQWKSDTEISENERISIPSTKFTEFTYLKKPTIPY